MSERVIPGMGNTNETRNKIMETAITLFAQKGFTAVPMRDIAKTVGVNIASIYYHYDSKETLLEDILLFFTEGYRHYFDWLTDMNEKAGSLEEVMDNMFNDEFVNMQNPMACLVMSLAIKEQHKNELARKCVFELFYTHSVARIKADFDRLIERGVIPPSDTNTIAMLFMFCVIVSNDLRVHEYMGTQPPLNSKEIYAGMKKHIYSALLHGNQSAPAPNA